MATRGPCAVRAVVDGVTKCHCMLGTVKQWHKGVDEPYAGCDVCDAYKCKKDAGVKVGKTGLGRKRQRTAAEEPASSALALVPSTLLELLEPLRIVGHRLFDADGVRSRITLDDDLALCEELMPDKYRIELLVRGRFRVAGCLSDHGGFCYCGTRWAPGSEPTLTRRIVSM